MRLSSRNRWLQLPRDERGNVAMMFGLAAVPLLGLTMATIEYGLMARRTSQLQAASDAASVALAPLAATHTPAQLKAKAESIFRAFVGNDFTVDPPVVSAGGTELTLVARTNYRTQYLRAPVMPSANHEIKVASRTIVTKTHYEIALVLDNSGSMASSAGGKSKMTAAKEAAAKLVETMFSNPMSRERTSISLVPFTLTVNVGQTYRYASWMDLQARSTVHWQNTDFNEATATWKPESKWKLFDELNVPWGGCVEHRPGHWGVTDAGPSAADGDSYFVPQFAPDEPGGRGANSYSWKVGNQTYSRSYPNSYLEDHGQSCPATPALGTDGSDDTLKKRQNRLCKYRSKPSLTTTSGRGPNYMCDARPLTRLQKDQSALTAQIANMVAAGNTNLLEGFMWGWRTLSPNGPFMDGKRYDQKDNRKIIILMTDGMNAWSAQNNHNKSVYSPFGYYTQNRLPEGTSTAGPNDANQARVRIDAHTLKACTNAKDQGVQVYTVGFSTSSDPIDSKGLDLLKNCATSPSMAYVANNSETIVKVFEEIARNIGGLRIAE